MTKLIAALAATAAVALSALPAAAGCSDAALASVRARILAGCPCNGNHGQYVSCVARAVREAAASGELDTNCKGKVVHCAARSTCGKKDTSVTCAFCGPGTCTGGHCDDGVTACTSSTQCPPVVNRCSTRSSPEMCTQNGGIVGHGSCCSASCTPS